MTKARTNADNASADIQGVTAGTGLTGGGTSGTVTLTNDMATTIAAKGDLVAGTANDTYAALTVGANNTVLTADSTTATGLKWATPTTGDITGVTAGTGISGGGTSGDVTITNSMATAIDAKGDLVAGTGADAFARLAVGSNGTFLKANSAAATGLEWGAASASKSYSLLGTATLTAAGTITISGLSGYDNLMITVDTARGPANGIMTMKFNASAGPYPQFGQLQSQGASYSVYTFQANTQPSAGSISFGDMSNNVSSSVSGMVQVLGANGSGLKAWTSVSGSVSNGAATTLNYIGGGMFEPTAVISSVSILCNAGGNNFNNGTMKVYGAA